MKETTEETTLQKVEENLVDAENIEVLPSIEEALAIIKEPITDKVKTAIAQALETELVELQTVAGYNKADKTVKSLVKLLSGMEKERKRLVDPAVKYQRSINAEVKTIKEQLENARDHLKSHLKLIDDEKARIELELKKERVSLLTSAGFSFDGFHYVAGETMLSAETITSLTEEEFKAEYENGKVFIADLEAKKQAEIDERLAEQKKLDKQKAELDAQLASLEKDKEELRQLRAEKENRLKKEGPGLESISSEVDFSNDLPSRNEPIFKQPVPSQNIEQANQSVITQAGNLKPMYEPETETEQYPDVTEDHFQQGFINCKQLILKEFNSGIKKNRTEWVIFISHLKPSVAFKNG